jgi:hypothetical protein
MLKSSAIFIFGVMAILLKKLKYSEDITITRGNDCGIRKMSSVPAINEKRTTLTGDVANLAKAVRATRAARPDFVIAPENKNDAIMQIKFCERNMMFRKKKRGGRKYKIKHLQRFCIANTQTL